VKCTALVPPVFSDKRKMGFLPSRSLTVTNASVSWSKGFVGLSGSKRTQV
jgi:hypothetical protein